MEESALIANLFTASAALHHHLCPRQVLGVRMGMLAAELLSLSLPQTDKRLLTIVEIDGCFTDGLAVATNCWPGKRTMQIQDFGKVAATVVDSQTNQAVRCFPLLEARQRAGEYASEATDRWQMQLLGYQRMPLSELFGIQWVELVTPVGKIISSPDKKMLCTICGEEIFNEREHILEGRVVCRSCAGSAYYRLCGDE
jgi:formylmethanofuran dehydrogenase subunit E